MTQQQRRKSRRGRPRRTRLCRHSEHCQSLCRVSPQAQRPLQPLRLLQKPGPGKRCQVPAGAPNSLAGHQQLSRSLKTAGSACHRSRTASHHRQPRTPAVVRPPAQEQDLDSRTVLCLQQVTPSPVEQLETTRSRQQAMATPAQMSGVGNLAQSSTRMHSSQYRTVVCSTLTLVCSGYSPGLWPD